MTPHKNSEIPEKYVFPFNMNGLNGRYVKIPHSKKKREIFLVYGHHSSLERMYPIATAFSKYGTVTMPDLPGFGGMDSLYKIGEEPTVDTLADYLAAFIKLHYKRKTFTIVGFSLGSAIVTRMQQKYPEIASSTNLLVSVSGFTSWKDFKIPKRYFVFLRSGASILSGRLSSKLYRRLLLNKFVIRTGYKYTKHAKHKLKDIGPETMKKMIDFEVELWQANDARTHARTAVGMFTVDLTRWQVPLSIHYVSFGEGDQYFDEEAVEKHMKLIFSKLVKYPLSKKTHMPSVIADQAEAEAVIPPALRRLLARQVPKKRKS